ncbi:MAG: hypothetical protein COW11_06575 [Candidatus Omnitrophica bacterium CG12_big_fil_rev_8_21_14_0_65_43_15]|uniref:Uncharacterized protein n=1 Tax=Candidatus Taenaricola geysiri TaxID=1974752 RepID=A0A2J0LMA1_9BACT|nr:MAG: hypothetical protein AUJ89_00875 [Candidatus Omnitrophica bacterium CG1_02_43_210]PIR66196.1 MAG: hypothetical protein COU52_00235 [Candidatus Omnitrophica bacterium CG10_big_fil_rev_8_21_14_0_10_43_8]PIV11902.1 MAG: hypothetical protein COS48_03575 [Candidatus Omnitrophica bacterium CG03_land_8_20_14_0_80_43_22]PIW65816.1 MAG: hypothetical protein COW11_06575 [Candidatus Omnitrophica bacterium CG12_big_fil_rev_8_21_14_0_65_43_15]PIY84496.1 MAG: hypothetical protein COY77_02070 [Candida
MNKGFLLFEVLIAMVILVVGITMVLKSFNTSITTVKSLREYSDASYLLDEKALELELYGPQKIGYEGSFEGRFSGFSWKIDADSLSVIWGPQASAKSLSVLTYVVNNAK